MKGTCFLKFQLLLESRNAVTSHILWCSLKWDSPLICLGDCKGRSREDTISKQEQYLTAALSDINKATFSSLVVVRMEKLSLLAYVFLSLPLAAYRWIFFFKPTQPMYPLFGDFDPFQIRKNLVLFHYLFWLSCSHFTLASSLHQFCVVSNSLIPFFLSQKS